MSSAGCATYHWSSWSSPATSTADGAAVGAPGAAGLLPHRCERAGEAVEHDRVEAADVDAELERVRGRDAEQPAARELELERAALRREVAGPVRGDARTETGLELLEPRARVLRDELGAAPAARERERGVAGADEPGEQLGGLDVGRRARAGVLVEQRSLPAREHALGSRRSVVVDLLDRQAAQLARERAGVADRRAREAERRVRAVVLADAPQPAEHVRDVTAEDPALRVQLVDHDVAQPHHERRPALVRRQDPDVQHVGIGEHDVRVLAGPRAVVGVGVAVEGDGAQAGHQPRTQRAELVVRERLRREDEQRGVAPVGRRPTRRSAPGSRATSPTRCRSRSTTLVPARRRSIASA